MILYLRWDGDHEQCGGCGTREQDRPHVAEGLCTDCFPRRYGDFGLGDVRPRWAEPGATLPAPPAAALEIVGRGWGKRWPRCLICDRTKHGHSGQGVCRGCHSIAWRRKRDGRGVAVIWLPFSKFNIGAYHLNAAKWWAVPRDMAEAWRYLERRAAAGGIPTGGKVVIRQTARADELPERVIRAVTA